MLRHRNFAHDLFCLTIIGFGFFVIYSGLELSIGTMRRIGPGFFPLGLGAIMAILGVGLLFERQDENRDDTRNPRGLIFISLALAAFAGLLETLGLFPATAAMVLLVVAAEPERVSLPTVVGLIAGLWAVGYLLFVVVLRLPLQPLVPEIWTMM